jgi:hypothetical protein
MIRHNGCDALRSVYNVSDISKQEFGRDRKGVTINKNRWNDMVCRMSITLTTGNLRFNKDWCSASELGKNRIFHMSEMQFRFFKHENGADHKKLDEGSMLYDLVDTLHMLTYWVQLYLLHHDYAPQRRLHGVRDDWKLLSPS